MTKGEWAKSMRLSPSAVSKLLKRGKLPDGVELVGEGQRAMVRVPETVARAPSTGMSPSQQLTQLVKGQARRPSAWGGEARERGAADQAPAEGAASGRMDDNARILRAKAESAEIEARRARQKELAEAGVYMTTTAAATAWARELAELLRAIDLWLPELAEDLAAAGGGEHRVLATTLRSRWRAFRQARADLASAVRDELPEHVDAEGRPATSPSPELVLN